MNRFFPSMPVPISWILFGKKCCVSLDVFYNSKEWCASSSYIGWAQCGRVSANDCSKVVVTRSMPFAVISYQIASSSHHVHLLLALVLQFLKVFTGNATPIVLDLISYGTLAGASGNVTAFLLIIWLGFRRECNGRERAVLEGNFLSELNSNDTRL